MACGSCGLQLSFGKRRGSRRRSRRSSKRSSKRSTKLRHRRRSRRSRRRSRRSKKLLEEEEMPKRRRHRRRGRKSRKSRRSRRFGIVAGPGFKGQTSYSNAYAPYFGSREPFVAASEWWAPLAGGIPQYPQMLYKNAGPVNYPGN